MVYALRRTQPPGRDAVLKYGHHPHLMELAVAPRPDTELLHRDLEALLRELDRTAGEASLRIVQQPDLPVDCDDPRIVSPLYNLAQLRRCHRELYFARGALPEKYTNYAACVASTRTQIGIDWWSLEGAVDALYRTEAENATFAYRDYPDPQRVRAARWRGFSDVFQGHPLAGIPSFSPWSIQAWCEAMLDSPLAGLAHAQWVAKTPRQIRVMADDDMPALLRDVRDLQVIRPGLNGTLEFCGDPAQSGAVAIAELVAHRLACVKNVVRSALPT